MEECFSLQEILEVTGGRIINIPENKKILIHPSQICTDTRVIKKGDFFIALKGEHFDGNDFIDDACSKGAEGAIVNKLFLPSCNNFFVVQVDDTLRAFQELAKFYRQKLSIPLIAVTGSNGKTTVKELIAHILSNRYLTSKSSGNFNNQIGVPLSILRLSSRDEVGVLELGMNQRGEIENLSRIVQPDIGVITNVHRSHPGMVGSISEIAQAKAEMIPFLNRNRNNYLIINGDSPWSGFFRNQAKCRVLTFGMENKANLVARNIQDEGERIKFDLVSVKGESISITLPFPGLFNIYNTLAASAVCLLFGISLEEIKKAVENFSPPPLRCQIKRYGKYKILDDCYNANPDSMKMALYVLRNLKGGRKIAVLGDMLELGEYSPSLHTFVGELVASLKLDALFALGRFAPYMVAGAKKEGLKQAFCFEDKQELLEKLLNYVNCEDWLLVKGSRETKMEEVIKGLKNQ